MPITVNDIERVTMSDEDIQKCIEVAARVTAQINDRPDLHPRDYLERFIDVLLGEIAEYSVIKWLKSKGKYARSVVDKESPHPDPGHDIVLKSNQNKEIKCSVKSSISAFLKPSARFLSEFTFATKESEVRDVNIQVYFWYDICRNNTNENLPRTSVPSTKHFSIIGWIGLNEIRYFKRYKTEKRQAPEIKLKDGRPLKELLQYLL